MGTRSAPITLMRCSQVEESASQTSGTRALPLAWPSPVRVAPFCAATAAATSAGSCASTTTETQVPLFWWSDHSPAAVRTAGAISGAAATVTLTREPQEGLLSSR